MFKLIIGIKKYNVESKDIRKKTSQQETLKKQSYFNLQEGGGQVDRKGRRSIDSKKTSNFPQLKGLGVCPLQFRTRDQVRKGYLLPGRLSEE